MCLKVWPMFCTLLCLYICTTTTAVLNHDEEQKKMITMMNRKKQQPWHQLLDDHSDNDDTDDDWPSVLQVDTYRVVQKISHRVFVTTSSNINPFPKFFHPLNQQQICNKVITKDPTTPHTLRYTTLWNINVSFWILMFRFTRQWCTAKCAYIFNYHLTGQ